MQNLRETAFYIFHSRLHYDSSLQERIVIEKADQEEEAATTAANRPVVPAVEHKHQETTETSANVVKKKCDVDIDMHDAPNAMVATPTVDHPLERPTNLSLAKQEVSLVDALNTPNPTSPISKQVSLKLH